MTSGAGRTPAALLAEPVGDTIVAGEGLSGFGGLHGGLALALLTSAMGRLVPGLALRSTTAQFVRPLQDGAAVDARLLRQGRLLSATEATAGGDGEVHVRAGAVWGSPSVTDALPFAPDPPAAPSPEACPVFVVPPEIVAFGRHVEIRAVGPARPFTGGAVPELLGWIRLIADDEPPDVLRMITLIDALAPSYSAVMDAPRGLPTIELTVRPAPALAAAASPWSLVRASTVAASSDGWLDERIDVWGLDGRHLASAEQLRVVRA
jgi:Acyl-CoA thioesterase C-terminal domain/Acyl-CoA thioesterase N-terminal domain